MALSLATREQMQRTTRAGRRHLAEQKDTHEKAKAAALAKAAERDRQKQS